MKIKKQLITILSLVAFLLSLSVSAFAQESPRPSVIITSPVSGEIYANEPVEFLFNVENFVFVSYKNFTTLFPGNPNAGHAHLWVDPPPEGVSEDTVFEVESADFHELGELEPGRYTLSVELVRNDHTRFNPRVYDSVSFRVSEKTERGRYAIIKTESEDVVGSAPPQKKPLVVILTTALAIVLAWAIKRFWQKHKNKSYEEKNDRTPKRKIYDRIRRRNDKV